MKKLMLLSITLMLSLSIHAQGNDHKSGDANDYCIQSDGNKIYVIYQGINMVSDVVLDNGTTVKTDGTIITKDGKTTVLRVGQCINRDGTIWTSNDELDKHSDK